MSTARLSMPRSLVIDRNLDRWPYQQLADQLAEAIVAGRLGPQLASIADLSERSGLATHTVQRALADLRGRGLVHSVAGLGYFTGVPRPHLTRVPSL